MLLYFGPKAGLGLIKSKIYPPSLQSMGGNTHSPPPSSYAYVWGPLPFRNFLKKSWHTETDLGPNVNRFRT